MKPKKIKYRVAVIRTYTVTDEIEVEATSSNEATNLAVSESDNKDYTGQLQLDRVSSEILAD